MEDNFFRSHQFLAFYVPRSWCPSLDSLLCTMRRLLRFEWNCFRYCFTCRNSKKLIWVISIFIYYCTTDGSGRLEWNIFKRSMLYFFHCIMSSFSRRTRKRDCLVNFFVAKLGLKCFLFFCTFDNTLCEWPTFPLVTIPIKFLLLQIIKLVRHTPQEFKLPLLKKSQLIFIHWSIRQLMITEFSTDWSP